MNKLVHWEIPSTDVERSGQFYAQAMFLDPCGCRIGIWSQT